jgi:predicted transposase YbfD/YdcC
MIRYCLLQKGNSVNLNVFSEHFSSIEDTRQSAKVTYPLFDVLFLTLCAVIAGCQGWEDIEDFGENRLPWLKKLGFFALGLPVHDTIARIIARIEPTQLQHSFANWMQAVAVLTDGEVVAIDGKTLCSSYNRKCRRSAIHMVSAFATANGVVMGQVKTEEKSNEITAIPELLDLLSIKGCLVTIDAMGCQKEIAAKIVDDKGADYLLAVKGNQEKLHKGIQSAFREHLKSKPEQLSSVEKAHGRLEYREYHVLASSVLPASITDAWVGLKTIGLAISYRMTKHKKSRVESRYFISSATLSSSRFAKAVRSHWGIENKLHWVLDVSMEEDDSQIFRGHAAANMATMRHLGLNMLRAETSKAMSVPRKQRRAHINEAYLEQVLLAGLSMDKK